MTKFISMINRVVLMAICGAGIALADDQAVVPAVEPAIEAEATSPQHAPTFGSNSGYSVEVGTRILYVDLLSDKQGEPFDNSFIGSINQLEADQNYAPLHPFVQIHKPFKKGNVGLGVSYDELKVDTEDNGGGDGTIESQSLQLYVIGTLTGYDKFVPFAELGVSFWNNSFDPIPSWSENGKRAFNLDDSTVPYFAAGCGYQFCENWMFDLYIRYMDVDVDGEYVFKGDDRDPESFTFTLEHLAYGVGVNYRF